MTVGPPPQSVTKERPTFAFSSQPESTLKGRVVHGHDRLPGVAVHWAEMLHPPWHCILTVRGTVLSLGTPLNAFLLMLRMLALYCIVSVLICVFWNAC